MRREWRRGEITTEMLTIKTHSGPVMHLLQKFLTGKTFAPIVTREFRPPKPDPAGILHIARAWGLEDRGEGLIMVSWSLFWGPRFVVDVD